MRPRTGALLIHGLGGTQFDLGSMHKHLKRCGIETHSLTLPGHGTTPEALVSIRAEAWIEAVRAKYRELIGQYEVFHVMGMCMGALLAAALCALERHDKGRLVTLAPPLYIDGWSTPWWRAARHLAYYLPVLPARMKIEESEPFGIKNALVRNIVKAKFARGDNFHYRWVPLACIREVDRLRRQVKRDLPGIACPTLVVHAREDELTSLKSAALIARKAPDARVVVLENSYHMICVDNDRDQVVSSVLDFFEAVPQETAAAIEVQPCTPDEVQSLLKRFTSAMREQRYEDVFALLSADVRWEQGGSNPVARVYEDRNALIALFSQFSTLSAGTFRVVGFGEPDFASDGTVRVPLFTEAAAAGTTLAASGRLQLAFGGARIRAVRYEPDRCAEEDAFWNAAARSADGEAARFAMPAPSGVDPALSGAALAAAFEVAVAEMNAPGQPLPSAVLLRLHALYSQARSGDARGARPGVMDTIARAKYDAWAQLRGTSRGEAMCGYVSYARSLAQD